MRVERVFIGEKRGFVFETKTCDVRRHRIDQGCFEVDCIQAGSNPTGTYPTLLNLLQTSRTIFSFNFFSNFIIFNSIAAVKFGFVYLI